MAQILLVSEPPADLDATPKASHESSVASKQRLTDIADRMKRGSNHQSPWNSASVVASMATMQTGIFGALCCKFYGKPVREMFVMALCDTRHGRMVDFDTDSLQKVGESVWQWEPRKYAEVREGLKRLLVSAAHAGIASFSQLLTPFTAQTEIRDSRSSQWNVVLCNGFGIDNRAAAAFVPLETPAKRDYSAIALVAFKREDWERLDDQLVVSDGEVAMALAKVLHKRKVCRRYDVCTPQGGMWTLPAAESRCAFCHEAGHKLCSSCCMVRYCSVQCQLADRPRHKAECAVFGEHTGGMAMVNVTGA